MESKKFLTRPDEQKTENISIHGTISRSKEVIQDVTQGSVVEQLLFLILVSGLSLGCKALLFVDNTTLIARDCILMDS